MTANDRRDRVTELELEREGFTKLEMRSRTIMYKIINSQTYQFTEREPGLYEYSGIFEVREPGQRGVDVHEV